MLTYNTQQKRLILPEYGRNIQQMVDHCLTIEDRKERTDCAYAIIRAMGNLFPALRDGDDAKKLWDHLMIMSDFRLDIDFPFEPIGPDRLNVLPDKIPYTTQYIKYRHYGKTIEHLVDKAVTMDEGPERDALVLYIANHMKNSCWRSTRTDVTTPRYSRTCPNIATALSVSTLRRPTCMSSNKRRPQQPERKNARNDYA